MSSLLYISISSDLTKDEIFKIDQQVKQNQERVCVFIKKLPSNSKRKARKLFLYSIFLFQLSQPVFVTAAVVLPLPPSIDKFSSIEESKIKVNHKSSQFINIYTPKVDKIKLTDNQIKEFNDLVFQLNSGSMSIDEVILQLRGGDGLIDLVVIIAVVIFANWYNSSFGAEGFMLQDPFAWWNGQYDSKSASNGQCLSDPPSRFERKTLQQMKQMCSLEPDENGFVMTYDEAYNLIKETYNGALQITPECKISDWQCAKKAYHFQNGFGIDLDSYPIDKKDLVTLQKADGGLIRYVQRGGKLPPRQFIKDSQQKVYDFCHRENTEINRNAIHYSDKTGRIPCIMFFNRETEQIALFNKTSCDLITADKFRTNYFNKCVDSGQVGNPTN